MTTPRWLAPTAAALALGIATIAVLGPLGAEVIEYRVAPLLRQQLIGSDVVSLTLIAPLTLLAAALIRRRSVAGPLLALGPALVTAYLLTETIVGPDRELWPGNDEAFLPLFLVVFLLAGGVAVGAWQSVPPGTVALRPRTRRLVGALLLLVVGFFVFGRYLPAWLDILRGTASADYRAGPGMWWTIAWEDLGLLLPAAVACGVGLLRNARWAAPATFAVSGWLALIGAAVTGMAWSTTVHGGVGSTVETALTMTVIGLTCAAPAAICWFAVGGRPGTAAGPAPVHPVTGPDGAVRLPTGTTTDGAAAR